MAYAKAQSTDKDRIPIIDITALRDGSDVPGVAKSLHAASQGLGFIYIKGHGIPEVAIKQARNVAFNFFQSENQQKAGIAISSSHRGWLGQGGAKMDDDAKSDLKESFIWGYEDHSGNVLTDHNLRGQNQWPDYLPQMQDVSMKYFFAAHEVAHHLMRGFAVGLGLQDNFFLKSSDKPLSRASYVYYPAQPEDMGEDQFGVGPHTDFGVLTVLCQDSVGGLQVEDVNGRWIEAPPIDGTLIVNVADLLSRWTGGEYKSTPHRVINSSGKERLSLVLAFDPNPETIIDPSAIAGHREHHEETITCGDYLNWRFAKAFAYRKKT